MEQILSLARPDVAIKEHATVSKNAAVIKPSQYSILSVLINMVSFCCFISLVSQLDMLITTVNAHNVFACTEAPSGLESHQYPLFSRASWQPRGL